MIQFKDRYTFIGNRLRLKQYIDDTLKDPQSLVYVAVDGKEPVKVSDFVHNVCNINLTTYQDKRPSQTTHNLVAIQISTFHFDTATTHILLGYPSYLHGGNDGLGTGISCYLHNTRNI